MYKLEMHMHTREVSPCGRVDAETMIREYKRIGYGGVVITDHLSKKCFDSLEGDNWSEKVNSYLKGFRKAKEIGDEIGLDVFLGAEIKNFESNNEYLVHGIDEKFLYENEYLFTKPLSEIKKIVNDSGYLLFQAHPCRDACISVEKGEVDGWEAYNGHFNHNSRNASAKNICRQKDGIPISGSDAHDYCDMGNGGLIFKNKPENIAEEIKKGNYSLIESKPQLLSFLFADKRCGEEYIKRTAKENDVDNIIIYDGHLNLKTKNGRSISFKDGTAEIGRTFFISGTENAMKVPISEQKVILVDEITEKVKEKIADSGAVLVLSGKGDDVAPYREGTTFYASADMAQLFSGVFIIDLTGPIAKINKA